MAEDWAAGADERLKKEAEDRRLKEEREVLRRKIFAEQGPKLWGDIKSEIGKQVKELNDTEGSELIASPFGPADRISLFAKLDGGQRELTGEFSMGYIIDYRAKPSKAMQPDRIERVVMTLGDGNELALTVNGVEITAQEGAANMLNALMGWK